MSAEVKLKVTDSRTSPPTLRDDSHLVCQAVTQLIADITQDKPYSLPQFLITTMTALNYSLLPGIIEMMAGETPRDNSTLDTMRFTALFLHNMLLNFDHRHSTRTIIEHTTREYAVRYEMLSDVGEAILKRLEAKRK